MGILDRAREWVGLSPPVAPTPSPDPSVADGASAEGPVILIREADGTLTPIHAKEAKVFKVIIGGQVYEHVTTTVDGTWVYEVRKS